MRFVFVPVRLLCALCCCLLVLLICQVDFIATKVAQQWPFPCMLHSNSATPSLMSMIWKHVKSGVSGVAQPLFESRRNRKKRSAGIVANKIRSQFAELRVWDRALEPREKQNESRTRNRSGAFTGHLGGLESCSWRPSHWEILAVLGCKFGPRGDIGWHPMGPLGPIPEVRGGPLGTHAPPRRPREGFWEPIVPPRGPRGGPWAPHILYMLSFFNSLTVVH